MVPSGSVFTYRLSGYYGGLFTTGQDTAAALRSDVLARFRATNLDIRALSIQAGGSIGSYVSTRFPYNATITVVTKRDFGSEADVWSIVRGVFWNASDHEPLRGHETLPELPGLPSLNLSLGLIAVIVVGVAVVMFKR